MTEYWITIVLKSGKRLTNKDMVNQKFVDTIYDQMATNSNMVIQIALTKKKAVMVNIHNVDYCIAEIV